MKINVLSSGVRVWSLALAGVSGLSGALVAQAQDAPATSGGGLEEVVVTAQRRAQDLQDVPFAVSAFGEDAIEKSDIDEVTSLQQLVPGLRVAGDEKMNVVLRGVGADIATALAEAAVPVNIDGVYMSRTSIGSSVYADLASIEVLRGPQGTLYGRNATGGTINMWTKVPDGEFNGNVTALIGNGGRERFRGALGLPITDTLSARVAFASDDIDGYRRNLVTGEDVEGRDHLSYRASVRWEPTDTFSLTLRASQAENDNSTPVTVFGEKLVRADEGSGNPIDTAGGVGADDPLNVRNDIPPRLQTEDDIYSITAEWELGSVILKSVSAYQEHSVDRQQDSEGTSADWTWTSFRDNSSAFTQEFTLTSNGDGPLSWVAGVWYYDDDLDADMEFFLNPEFFLGPGGVPLSSFTLAMDQLTTAYAVFGQATWEVSDRMRLTAGARYSDEEKEFKQSRIFNFAPGFSFPVCQDFEYDDSWSNLAPKASVDYDLNDNVLVYGSVSQGFKAGGGNMSECNNRFDEETLTAYEVGFKSELLDNTMRLNVNGFFYDYEDYQVNRVIENTAAIENAPGAEVYGLEVELFAQPTERLSVSLGLSLQQSEFLDFTSENRFTPTPQDDGSIRYLPSVQNLDGLSLPNAPEQSVNLAVEYDVPLNGGNYMVLRGEYSWVDDHYFDQFNEDWSLQEAYGMTNLRLIWGNDSGLEVRAFVNNLEEENALRRVAPVALLGGTIYNFHEPRTYGFEVAYSFD